MVVLRKETWWGGRDDQNPIAILGSFLLALTSKAVLEKRKAKSETINLYIAKPNLCPRGDCVFHPGNMPGKFGWLK